MSQENKTPFDKFQKLLKGLARVPKHEIDAQERKYQKSRKTDDPAKPRAIVPRPRRSA